MGGATQFGLLGRTPSSSPREKKAYVKETLDAPKGSSHVTLLVVGLEKSEEQRIGQDK